MKSFLRTVLAVACIPLVIGLVWNFIFLLVDLGRHATETAIPFWLGLGLYFVFEAVFRRPVRTYVFGHELTHAVAGILSGARLKKFRVSSSGGSVTLTKSNVWIALAPYFVPVYTVIIVSLYWGAGQFWPVDRYYAWFLFAAGFSLSFHFGLTHFALSQGQTDLQEFGVFFSGVFILVISCVVLSVLMKLVFPLHVRLGDYFYGSLEKTAFIYRSIYEQAATLWTSFRRTN